MGSEMCIRDSFRDFVDGLGYTDMSYASGTAIRERVNELVYTANDEPPSFCVEPHNEMSYVSVYPTKVTAIFQKSFFLLLVFYMFEL